MPSDENQVSVNAQQGGAFAFEDENVRVTIPPRAFAKNARLVFRRILRNNHPNDRSGQVIVNRFALRALIDNTPTSKKRAAQELSEADAMTATSIIRRTNAVPRPTRKRNSTA